MSLPHSETALQRIQRIVTVASRREAPITTSEAYEQIVEELELAGFGSTELAETETAEPAAGRPRRWN